MIFKALIPSKFLCLYRLSIGAIIFAIIYACIQTVCIIILVVQMLNISKCSSCTSEVVRSSYGFSGAAVIYCVIMVVVHLWFLWAIKKRKSSVVLIWVVVTALWVLQTVCLALVLLFMFLADACVLTWVLCFVFGFIAFSNISMYLLALLVFNRHWVDIVVVWILLHILLTLWVGVGIAVYGILVGYGLYLELTEEST